MTFTQAITIYAIGWALGTIYWAAVFFDKYDEKNVIDQIYATGDPEVIEHWEKNVHNARTKLRLYTIGLPLLFALAFGSIWPVILAVRTVSWMRRCRRAPLGRVDAPSARFKRTLS